MDLMERLEFFFLGGLVGFVVGYIVARLSDIKTSVNEVKKELGLMGKSTDRTRNERGIMSHRWSANVALFIVVSLTLYAAVMSQSASNRSNDTADSIIELQSDQRQNLDCTTQILFDAIQALNDRTTYTSQQTEANIALVRSQYKMLDSFRNPEKTEEQRQNLFSEYVAKVGEFLKIAEQTRDQQNQNPYPTVGDLTACIAQTPR